MSLLALAPDDVLFEEVVGAAWVAVDVSLVAAHALVEDVAGY
jgi:hypothetical protein